MTTLDEAAVATQEQQAPAAVAERLVQVLNDGAIAVLGSIGHDTRTVRDLATLPRPPAPADRRRRGARRALRPRVARRRRHGGLVDYDPASRRVRALPGARALPHRPRRRQHRAHACGYHADGRRSTPQVLEQLPHRRRPRLRRLPAVSTTPGRGQRGRQRRLASSTRSSPSPASWTGCAAGIDVADVGCGEGHAVNLLAREFPAQPVLGLRLQRRGARRRPGRRPPPGA